MAKFRAARRLWAELMRERFRPADERSLWLRFHTQTAGSTLTAQQPDNNVVRVAIQALAAVCGGTQSLHTNARDEALGLPTEEAARLALRTQQILADESGVADVADPLGGAWAIEALTDEIEARARAYIERIDEMGGALAAVEAGFQEGEIAEAAYRHQRAVEDGSTRVVGVNVQRSAEQSPTRVLEVDPAAEARQIERLREMRARRDGARVEAALATLGDAADGDDNLMPLILDAVRAEATVGEVADTLRAAFGEHDARP